MTVEAFLQSWGYLGIFLGIVLTGVPFVPLPEELPIVVGGALAGAGTVFWWLMLPVCLLAVVMGDALLYTLGRLWGPRLLQIGWIRKHVLPPERRQRIEKNFQQHGIKILLFARLTPGFRGPIFFTAGLTRLSRLRFFLADAIYAVPGVTLLFFLGYWFAGSMLQVIQNELALVKHIVIIVVLLGLLGYVIFRIVRRPEVTGDPQELPTLPEKVSQTLGQAKETLGKVSARIIHPHHGKTTKTSGKT
jgi:membrane protein DedA with SNARE-associated domain